MKLLHKAQAARKISSGFINRLPLYGRLSGIEAPCLAKGLVQQGKSTEHAVVGQNTSTKDHTVAAHKAIVPNSNRLAVLAVLLKINGVTEQLRAVAGDSTEGTYGDTIGGVDVVVLGDRGVGAEAELCSAVRLMSEVGGRSAGGEAGDPIATADGGMLANFKSIQIYSHGKRSNARAGRHAQVLGKDPGKPDAGSGSQLKTKQSLKQGTFQGPR